MEAMVWIFLTWGVMLFFLIGGWVFTGYIITKCTSAFGDGIGFFIAVALLIGFFIIIWNTIPLLGG